MSRKGRAARRRALVRVEILTTAAELFRARGYRATSLDELAHRLGMSKATLYGQFRSKDDLLAAIFHRTMTLVESGLADIRRSGASPVEQLRRVVRHQVRTVVAEQAFLGVFFAEDTSLPPRLGRAIARRTARYDRSVQAIIEAGARAGTIVAPRPRLLVWALLGMSNWVYRWFDPRGAWDADEVADAFVALLEHGYLRRPRAGRRDVARRLARIEREVQALRPLLDGHARRDRRRLSRP
jgi:AcrR family transcriptional regulator